MGFSSSQQVPFHHQTHRFSSKPPNDGSFYRGVRIDVSSSTRETIPFHLQTTDLAQKPPIWLAAQKTEGRFYRWDRSAVRIGVRTWASRSCGTPCWCCFSTTSAPLPRPWSTCRRAPERAKRTADRGIEGSMDIRGMSRDLFSPWKNGWLVSFEVGTLLLPKKKERKQSSREATRKLTVCCCCFFSNMLPFVWRGIP